MKRVVIIGCGSIGKRHIRNLKTLGVTEIYCLRTRKGFTQDLPTNIQVEEVYSWSDLIKKKPDIALSNKIGESKLYLDNLGGNSSLEFSKYVSKLYHSIINLSFDSS